MYSPIGGDHPFSTGRPACHRLSVDRLPRGCRCAPPLSPSAAARLRRGTGRSRALCPDGFFAPPRSSREARRGGGRPPGWRYPSVIMVKVGSMPVQQEVCSRHCPEAPRATPPAAAAPSLHVGRCRSCCTTERGDRRRHEHLGKARYNPARVPRINARLRSRAAAVGRVAPLGDLSERAPPPRRLRASAHAEPARRGQ